MRPGLVSLVGISQGLFGGLVGLGGGVIAAPLLKASGFTQLQASATTLPAVIASGIVGGIAFFMAGQARSREEVDDDEQQQRNDEGKKIKAMPVVMTSLGGMVASPIAARYAMSMKGPLLSRLMGVFMLASAPTVVYKDELVGKGSLLKKDTHPAIAYASFFAVGVLSGVATGLFGVGGGVVKVPLLSMLMDHQAALGTSLLTMIPPSSMALYAFSRKGFVQWKAVPWLIVGAGSGGWVATNFTIKLKERDQRLLFAAIVTPLSLLQLRG